MRSNKLMLLVPALLFSLCAAFISLRAEATFTAEAQLILTRDNLDIIALDSSDRAVVDGTIITHAENILNSRALAEQVITQLELQKDPLINPYFGVDEVTEDPDFIRRALYKYGLIEPSGSDNTTLQEAEQTYLLEWLQDRYFAAALPNSNVVSVQVSSHDAVLSANIANALVEGFLDFSFEASQNEAEQAIKALTEHVQELRVRAQSDQTALQNAQASADLAAPGALQALSAELSDIKARELDTLSEINDLREVQDMLTGLDGLSAEGIISEFSANVTLTAYSAQALSRAPSLESATEDLARLQNTVRSALYSLERRYRALESSATRLEQRLLDGNAATITLNRLEVELETTTEVYASALARLKELVMERGLRNTGGRFLTRAVPPVKANSQGRRRFVGIAMVLGLFVGATAVLVREAFNERVRSLNMVTSPVGSHRRVEIPRLRKGLRFARARRKERLLAGSESSFSEAIRFCRRLILEQLPVDGAQIVCVVSALPGEGKTTLCAGLARSFVLVGKNVLVVDADMRAKGLSRDVLGHLPAQGLQQALEVTPSEAASLISTSEELGFDCLPAGQSNKNPADLLERPEFATLLSTLKSHYDLILIDTPPLLKFPDARNVAEHASHTLMVVGYNQTPITALREVFTILPQRILAKMTLALTKTPASVEARYGVGAGAKAYKV